MRIQCGCHHQRLLRIFRHLFFVHLDAPNAVLFQRSEGLCQQINRFQERRCHYRHVHVQFEISLRCGHPDYGIIAHHAYGYHGGGFRLSRVHLPRHDGTARLVGWNGNLTHSASRAAGQPANVVGHLHQIGRQSLQCAVSRHVSILRRQGMEFVRCGDEILSRQTVQVHHGLLRESLRRIQAGAHCRTSQRDLLQGWQGSFHVFQAVLHHGFPAADLLTECQRNCILKMGSSGLDGLHVFLFQLIQGLNHAVHRRNQLLLNGEHRCNAHGRRKGIVGALGFVHIIVGMEHPASCQIRGTAGNDLVHVHIGLGTASGLIDHQRKMIVQFSLKNFIAHDKNIGRLLRRQHLQVHVSASRCILQIGKCVNDFHRHLSAHLEVLKTPLRLCTPVPICRYLHFSHRILFDSVFHLSLPFPLRILSTINGESDGTRRKQQLPPIRHPQWHLPPARQTHPEVRSPHSALRR